MNYIKKTFSILFYLMVLAVLFVACRLVVLLLGWEAQWTAVLFGAFVVGYFLFRQGIHQYRRIREERRAVKLLDADRQEQGAQAIDPQLAANMHMTWKNGLDFLGKSRIGRSSSIYALPWYLSLTLCDDHEKSSQIIQAAGVHGAEPENHVGIPDFKWVFSGKAVWLDLDFASRPDADTYWPLFMRELVSNRGKAPLGGITVILDAGELLGKSDSEIREQAAQLRARLDVIIKITGARVPVYLFVNRIDRLYGLRSLVRNLPSETLDKPFGAFRLDEDELPGDFAQRILERCADALSLASRENIRNSRSASGMHPGFHVPEGEAAAVQGHDELLRLGHPLFLFSREAFSSNPYHMVPFLRGLFLGSSGPEGDTIPPNVSDFTTLRFEHENPEPEGQWFWQALVEDQIPSDPAPVRAVRRRRHTRAVSLHAGLVALLVCTLAVCWLMTHIYVDNRNVMRAVAGKTDMPSSRRQLKEYLDNTLFVDNSRLGWWHPRMGFNEVDNLAEVMKQRYSDAYLTFELKPEFERIDKDIQSIAEEKDPTVVGKLMLFLAVMKDVANDDSDGQLLDTLLYSLHKSDPYDRLKAKAYMAWNDWHSHGITRDGVIQRERRIIETAMGGDAMKWLPAWVESIPTLAPVDLSSVFAPLILPVDALSHRRISPAWTYEGYNVVGTLLDSLAKNDSPGQDVWTAKRDRLLEQYRTAALKEWSSVSTNIWRDLKDGVRESSLPSLVLQASRADDPAMRMLELMNRRLLPMFDEDDRDPDVRWLKFYSQLLRIVKPALRAEGGNEQEPGLLVKVKDTVTGVARRIGSQAGAELLARNLGLTSGGSFSVSLDEFQSFMRAFGVINSISRSPDPCLEMVRQQFILDAHPTISLASLSASGAGTDPNGQQGATGQDGGVRDPIGDAKRAAQNLERAMYEINSTGMWTHLGPMASYHYMRFLLVRLSGNYINGLWLNTVYNPANLSAGTSEESRSKLAGSGGLIDTFMSGPAKGLWRRENRRLTNAVWDEIPFRFSPEFLSYCDSVVELGRMKRPDTINLGFRVDAVSVNREAKERPHTSTFVMREEGSEDQFLIYQNYNVATAFEWNLDPYAQMTLRFEFPSVTLEKTFSGNQALGEFIKAFGKGGLVLTAADFPDRADSMRRLGITQLSVRATMRNHAALIRYMYERTPELPRSIVDYGAGARRGQVQGVELPNLDQFMIN